MPQERLTKNQRREAAREAARQQREKQKRRERLMRWLIPTVATVGVLAVAAAVVWAFVINAPAPQSVAGPRNMISDGILFEGVDGKVTPVETGGISPTGEPQPTETEDDGLAHIVTYVDFSCPACKGFEETYSSLIQEVVASGQATLEVHPIAILDRAYAGSRYSSRSNNVGACVADLAPDSFLDVMAAMYAQQPAEGTTGLSNKEIIDVVHGAGLEDDAVDECIEGETFGPWVTAATTRASSDPDLIPAGAQGLSTPTIVVNGELWDRNVDVMQFIQSKITATEETPAG
ncbi:MAG TPA: thioredoxin domain-containing protein [Pseudolysinimonas sp.]|nr:thioredoxin domain-containing protein [Pseudolysinimonas sp.]